MYSGTGFMVNFVMRWPTIIPACCIALIPPPTKTDIPLEFEPPAAGKPPVQLVVDPPKIKLDPEFPVIPPVKPERKIQKKIPG